MNMITDIVLIIVGSLISLAIWAWILYEIIKSASYGKKIFEELELQTFLLIEMARKLGVDEKVIDEIAYEDDSEDAQSD